MKPITYLLSISIIMCFGACKHEPPIELCNPYSSSDSPIGWSQVYLPGYFRNPCYNPNNPNEIAFEQGVFGTSESPRICTFNLLTGEKKTIFTENTFSPPDWGANGKIIFTRPDYNIWQINPDGTGLIQLTSDGCYFGTCLSPGGTHFQTNGALCQNGMGTHLFTENGEFVTAYPFGSGSSGDWNLDSLICYAGTTGLTVADMNAPSWEFIYSGHLGHVGGACWLNHREIIWSYEKGIFITDFITRQTEMVISSCNAITYHHPTYHAVSNKVIWHKRVRAALGDALNESSKLVMMYPDGSMEEEIFIP